mmetsp:Transcript_44381/g.117750  ORF Transcript_44381/g.117750 Transcript_44381/m.117750 type:complete len:103 (+) Transcript_44381:1638-1946(+)
MPTTAQCSGQLASRASNNCSPSNRGRGRFQVFCRMNRAFLWRTSALAVDPNETHWSKSPHLLGHSGVLSGKVACVRSLDIWRLALYFSSGLLYLVVTLAVAP